MPGNQFIFDDFRGFVKKAFIEGGNETEEVAGISVSLRKDNSYILGLLECLEVYAFVPVVSVDQDYPKWVLVLFLQPFYLFVVLRLAIALYLVGE